MTSLLIPLVLVAGAANAEKPRTTLNDQFCQVYYSLDDGNCASLRDSVRSEIRGSGTPTLELGDPAEKPAMVFFHGWPDTNAMWANQFAAFCGDDGEYACIAPSMMNYNPDVEPVDNQSKLSWPLQADVLHEVVTDLGLKNITLVLYSFGCPVGCMYMARHPDIVRRVVMLDIGNNPGPPLPTGPVVLPFLTSYQRGAIAAYEAKNNTAMGQTIRTELADGLPPGAPCQDCKIAPGSEDGVGYRTGWMHFNLVNDNPPWTSHFDTPLEEYEFGFAPTWPDDVPQLFLWTLEMFHSPELLTWLDRRGDGSGHLKIGKDQDHWFMTRTTAKETNDAMANFFHATAVKPGAPSPAKPGAPSPAESGASGMFSWISLMKLSCPLWMAHIYF